MVTKMSIDSFNWKHSSSCVHNHDDYIYYARVNELDNETFDWIIEIRLCSHNPESIRTIDVVTGNRPFLKEAQYDVEAFIENDINGTLWEGQ
jgi:hypothetical protein